MNCLDHGYECRNGGNCVPRVLGDYVCSCPQPYCGATCTNTIPHCTNPFLASVKAGNCSPQNCNNRGVCVLRKNGSSTGIIGQGYDW